MSNLLKETLELLERNNKKETDVKWVGTSTHKTTWEDFKKNADSDYDSGYGSPKVAFKQQLEMDFIPAIEQMAEKERLHLQWLKSQNAKKEFIENSAFFLNHYRNRLKEYQDYASKL